MSIQDEIDFKIKNSINKSMLLIIGWFYSNTKYLYEKRRVFIITRIDHNMNNMTKTCCFGID